MKKLLSVAVVVAVVALVGGAALAHGPGGWRGGMWGGGPMGPGMMGMMGPGMMGGYGYGPGAGAYNCPGFAGPGTATPQALTDEKAKEIAQQYADQYLKGFTVERVLPFTMPHGTGYSVELKGPQGELRTFHINPWGNVMPFGGPWRRSS